MTDSKFLPINGNHREEDKFRTGQYLPNDHLDYNNDAIYGRIAGIDTDDLHY